MKTLYTYKLNCTDLTAAEVRHLRHTIDAARPVTFATIAKHCDWQWWAEKHGYVVGKQKGLQLKDDHSVRFFKSTWMGKPCYYIVWSSQEHIFSPMEGS